MSPNLSCTRKSSLSREALKERWEIILDRESHSYQGGNDTGYCVDQMKEKICEVCRILHSIGTGSL